MFRKLVLFDIDGTLLHTAGAGRRAIHAALLDELGAIGPFDGVRFDGKTDPQIVRELLAAAGHEEVDSDSAVAAVCDRYVGLLERELETGGRHLTVCRGVPQLLDRLDSRGDALLGLLTGNIARGAALKLTAAGIDPARFRVGAYGSDHWDRAELPPVAAGRAHTLLGRRPAGEEVVIVGDTPADMTCGAGIGARPIGVATGSYSAADLRAAGAFRVFRDFADPAPVLEAIYA